MAKQLASSVPTPLAAPATQATANAVVRAYSMLDATARTLVARAESTADKLDASASQYARTDEASALRLSETVDGGPRCE